MNEQEFLIQLEKRAREQELLIKKAPFHGVFFSLSMWLGENPWRVIIPIALLLTVVLRIVFGELYFNTILWIFGAV